MLLARLALFYVSVYGFGPSLAAIGPKLDPSGWGEPLSWHNFVWAQFPIYKSVIQELEGIFLTCSTKSSRAILSA